MEWDNASDNSVKDANICWNKRNDHLDIFTPYKHLWQVPSFCSKFSICAVDRFFQASGTYLQHHCIHEEVTRVPSHKKTYKGPFFSPIFYTQQLLHRMLTHFLEIMPVRSSNKIPRDHDKRCLNWACQSGPPGPCHKCQCTVIPCGSYGRHTKWLWM